MVTREKVLHDLNVTNGVLIKTCNCWFECNKWGFDQNLQLLIWM
jgi:hypothetical protein